jgi:hypothetical protein
LLLLKAILILLPIITIVDISAFSLYLIIVIQESQTPTDVGVLFSCPEPSFLAFFRFVKCFPWVLTSINCYKGGLLQIYLSMQQTTLTSRHLTFHLYCLLFSETNEFSVG